MASTEVQPLPTAPQLAKPRVGMLAVMQGLYDDMLPGITERQAAYAEEVAAALAGVAEVDVGATSQVESGSRSDWTTTA